MSESITKCPDVHVRSFEMKKVVSLSLMSLFVMSLVAVSPATAANDNKVVAGAKAIGKGIMWGPKKLWEGTKAVGKKIQGK